MRLLPLLVFWGLNCAFVDTAIPGTQVSYTLKMDALTNGNASMVFIDEPSDSSGQKECVHVSACGSGHCPLQSGRAVERVVRRQETRRVSRELLSQIASGTFEGFGYRAKLINGNVQAVRPIKRDDCGAVLVGKAGTAPGPVTPITGPEITVGIPGGFGTIKDEVMVQGWR